MNPIRVLIVDDSAMVRQTLSRLIDQEKDLSVIGSARDPLVAMEMMKKETPDVITLDIEMPRMDGLEFLRLLMSEKPLPVVICSSLTGEGADAAFRAIEFGAAGIITKPKLGTKAFLEESRIMIGDAIRAAFVSRIRRKPKSTLNVPPKLSADAVLSKGRHHELLETTEKVIVVGASTGGTEALSVFLRAMPPDTSGIVIVQHMPEHFTRAFAKRLDAVCRITVKEAAQGDSIIRGRALIAPGNRHTMVKRSGTQYRVDVVEGPLVNRHRPSVDVLFRSAARYAGKNAVGVIMTGMGDDGATGLLELKQGGARTIAQDESTCVVFGMPKVAIEIGAVDMILPLQEIAGVAHQLITKPNRPVSKVVSAGGVNER